MRLPRRNCHATAYDQPRLLRGRMGFDSVLSILMDSDWFFMATWIILLLGASALCFMDGQVPRKQRALKIRYPNR